MHFCKWPVTTQTEAGGVAEESKWGCIHKWVWSLTSVWWGHQGSPTEACVCCRNIVLLFSLLVLLVEGDLDSNGETQSCQVKPLERFLFWLMTQQSIWYNVSVFADVGIQAMSTGEQEVCQHTWFTVSLCFSSHLSLSLAHLSLLTASSVSPSVLPIKIKTPHLMKPPQVSSQTSLHLIFSLIELSMLLMDEFIYCFTSVLY